MEPEDIGKFFDTLIEKHGARSVKGLDYGSRLSQKRKFSLIEDLTDFYEKSLLDIGCGFGDLYHTIGYLLRSYTGIDVSAKAVEIARQRLPVADGVAVYQFTWPQKGQTKFDIIVMNGVLYLYPFWPAVKEMIEPAWYCTRELLVFDCLSDEATVKNEGEYYCRADQVLEACLKYTPYVAIRHDVAEHWFMVAMYREAQDA